MISRITFSCILLLFLYSCVQKEESNIPLPEHPRPNFERSVWQNLNGSWKFKADSTDIGLSENWQNQAEFFDQQIIVPFSWASQASGVKLPKVNVGWYSRTFAIEDPKEWAGKKVYLNFCASDFNTTIWVNGKEVGKHSGGYTPFDFDISDFMKEGENRLVVRVEDEELKNRPSGKQYYGNAKGIWQTVYLDARSETYIKAIYFTPDIDKKEVKVKVELNRFSNSGTELILDGSGIDFQGEIPANSNIGEFTVPVENMKLWDLDNPYLYEVEASVKGENADDMVSTYFGMRKISAVKVPGQEFQYVALNNKPIYMKLTLDQSYHPEGFYTFPSDKFMKEEIMRAKNLGLNGLRIHIKAEIPRKLYWADKLGLLIQEDVPNFWGEPDSTAKANWEQVATTEIARDYNCPSIFSWVLFNETWGLFTNLEDGKREYTKETQEWVREKYLQAKAFDPTRLVEDNSPCNHDHVITDINTWHHYSAAPLWSGYIDTVCAKTYPGSDYNFIGGNVQGNQPMFNSECGAVWGYSGSTGDIDITWEYHIMMNEFRKRPKIAGFLFTEFHDVINEWNGYYRFDRSEKIFGLDELCPGMSMKDFHTDLYVVSGKDFFERLEGGSTVQIPLGISAVTSDIPEHLKVKYSVYGWDDLGEKVDINSGEMDATAKPFAFTSLPSVSVELPDKNITAVFATQLVNGTRRVIQQNFVPFRITSDKKGEVLTVTQKPSEFTKADWDIKYKIRQNGNKVWGMGSGYFEYQFKLPENLNADEVESMEFRAELAARYPQEKYLEDDDAERIGMTVVSTKGIIPGYGKNSFPQTDENMYGSLVTVVANDIKLAEVQLKDDPADHRGILSWMNQEHGWDWSSEDHSKPWLLDEAGSYGYPVQVKLDEVAKNSALEKGEVTIRLYVDEQTSNRGGLSVYGAESGMYPLDLTLVIQKE